MGSIGEKFIDGRTVEELDFSQWDGFHAPPVSPPLTSRVYFDSLDKKLKASEDMGAYVNILGGGGGGAWGTITGTLSNQTDLQTALDAKIAGPVSATDTALAIFDGTTGKLLKVAYLTGFTGGVGLDTILSLGTPSGKALSLYLKENGVTNFQIYSYLTGVGFYAHRGDQEFYVGGTAPANRILLLRASDLQAIFGGGVTATSLTDSGLTSGRVPYATVGGLLADSANMTFDGTTLQIGGATNAVQISASGIVYLSGARPRRSFYVDASGIAPAGTAGAGYPTVAETSTNKVNYYYVTFPNPNAGVKYAFFSCPAPKDWDGGTMTVKFFFIPSANTGGTAFKWGVQGVCLGDNESPDTAYGTGATVSDTFQTAGRVHITDETGACTVAGTKAGEKIICWRVYRDVANNTADAVLMGFLVKYTATQESDA